MARRNVVFATLLSCCSGGGRPTGISRTRCRDVTGRGGGYSRRCARLTCCSNRHRLTRTPRIRWSTGHCCGSCWSYDWNLRCRWSYPLRSLCFRLVIGFRSSRS
eukprot:scaffold83217_cov40-Attheya_sp.AAC.1